MVFCSLMAYDPDDPRRDWSNKCLERLLRQMDNRDVFLKVEALERKWEDCLLCKVKAIQSALEMTDDFVCLVDTDILFRDGWIKTLKEFMKPYDPNEPVIAAFPEWTADGSYDFNDETTIHCLITWGGLPILQPRFYLNAGVVVVSVGAKEFVKDWLNWTLKANGLHEQNALCYLLHQRSDVRVVFLPEALHHIPPFLPDFEAVVPESVLAVHAIGSARNWLWERLAEGRFEIVGQKVAVGDKLRSKRQYKEALKAYYEAVAAGENLPRAYLGIGACYMALGQIDDAIAAYQQALSLRPNYSEAFRQLGECYELQGNYTTAFEFYQKALRLEPDNIGGKVKIGSLLKKLLRATGTSQKSKGVKVFRSWFV